MNGRRTNGNLQGGASKMIRSQQENSAARSRWIAAATLAIGVALGSVVVPGRAHATPIIVPVTKCGTTISSAGFYQVTKSLNVSQARGKDCIDISASNVILDILNTNSSGNPCSSTTIGGDSTSKSPIGIHILSSAKNVFIEGQNSNVVGWQTGIEDDGSSATGENFNVSNNINIGLLLNGVTGSSFSNFFAGILEDDLGQDCYGVPQSGPQTYGVEVLKSTGAQILNATAAGNALYGIWFDDSSTSRVSLAGSGPGVQGNTVGAFWFGCNNNGNPTKTCTGHGTGNLVYDTVTAVANPVSGQPEIVGGGIFGMVVEKGETGYTITDNTADNNNIDIYAVGDPGCNANTYFFNFAGFPSTPCINNP
jgi:hypothetical protein